MPVYYDPTTPEGIAAIEAEAGRRKLSGVAHTVIFAEAESRTSQVQFDSMQLWIRRVSEYLEASGLSMHVALAARKVEVPWTEVSFKEQWWKPILKVMFGKSSTKKQSTTECPEIAEVLKRHFAQEHGLDLPPWPTNEH